MMSATTEGSSALMAPSLKRRMASFVYEGLLLFGIGLIPGAIGALFVALTGHQHPLQSDSALRTMRSAKTRAASTYVVSFSSTSACCGTLLRVRSHTASSRVG